MLAAQDVGCAGIYCTDKIDARCSAAESAGANWAGNPNREDVVAKVLEQVPLGLDIVFECCGKQDALDHAVDMLRPGGKLAIIGIPEVDSISFKPERIRRRELSIINIRRQRNCVQQALDLIGKRRAEVEDMITHRYGFAESKGAFDQVADYRDGVVKAMIDFD